MTPSEQSQSPLAEPPFIALVCAGYVAIALAYYFMFNHANLQLCTLLRQGDAGHASAWRR